MRSRVRKVASFLALNLLFFALYLNFVHADAQQLESLPTLQKPAAAFGDTKLVENPDEFLRSNPLPSNAAVSNAAGRNHTNP